MMNARMKVRCWAALLGVVGLMLVSGYGGTIVEASARYPVCEEYCSGDAYCADTCGVWNVDHYDYINCGEYNGGAENGQCSTCLECDIWSAPEQEVLELWLLV